MQRLATLRDVNSLATNAFDSERVTDENANNHEHRHNFIDKRFCLGSVEHN